MWNATNKVYVAQERGFHSSCVQDFLPQISGINTQSKELAINFLQEQNLPPKKLIEKIRKSGVAEKHLPTVMQLNNLKASLKNDHSINSKHRLLTHHDLKEHFMKYKVTSKEQYKNLGKQLHAYAPFFRLNFPTTI